MMTTKATEATDGDSDGYYDGDEDDEMKMKAIKFVPNSRAHNK